MQQQIFMDLVRDEVTQVQNAWFAVGVGTARWRWRQLWHTDRLNCFKYYSTQALTVSWTAVSGRGNL